MIRRAPSSPVQSLVPCPLPPPPFDFGQGAEVSLISSRGTSIGREKRPRTRRTKTVTASGVALDVLPVRSALDEARVEEGAMPPRSLCLSSTRVTSSPLLVPLRDAPPPPRTESRALPPPPDDIELFDRMRRTSLTMSPTRRASSRGWQTCFDDDPRSRGPIRRDRDLPPVALVGDDVRVRGERRRQRTMRLFRCAPSPKRATRRTRMDRMAPPIPLRPIRPRLPPRRTMDLEDDALVIFLECPARGITSLANLESSLIVPSLAQTKRRVRTSRVAHQGTRSGPGTLIKRCTFRTKIYRCIYSD